MAEARDDGDDRLRWCEFRPVQGVAYRFSPWFAATLLLRGGAGWDRFAFSGSAPYSATSGTGRHDAIAVELGVDIRLTARLAVVTGRGRRASRHRLRDETAATEITLDQAGPTVVLGLVWR